MHDGGDYHMAEMPVRISMFESYPINAISLFKVSQMEKGDGSKKGVGEGLKVSKSTCSIILILKRLLD
jgi:hypothetical protein